VARQHNEEPPLVEKKPPNPRKQPSSPKRSRLRTESRKFNVRRKSQVASLALQQRYIRIGDSCGLEMLLAKGASGAGERGKEFGGSSAFVILAKDRLNPEPDNANTLFLGHVTLL
jgi:hypothetical protein